MSFIKSGAQKYCVFLVCQHYFKVGIEESGVSVLTKPNKVVGGKVLASPGSVNSCLFSSVLSLGFSKYQALNHRSPNKLLQPTFFPLRILCLVAQNTPLQKCG